MNWQYLNPPPFVHQANQVDLNDIKISQWIRPWDGTELVDVAIVGIPLSRSSISASSASEAPLALRQSWRSFSTYDVDHNVDLLPLQCRDLGDVKMHTTDILCCHSNIEAAVSEIYKQVGPNLLPIFLGGDHSISCPLVKGFVRHYRGKKIGLIQFDTHFDVRSLDDGGPSNGTPIRGLIQSGTLEGTNIYQLGIHGFANSKPYRDYVNQVGINFYTIRQLREQGVQVVLKEIVAELTRKVDLIYLTVDMDVLDISCFPGSPGASPGGMFSWELFAALHTLGKVEQVKGMDIVCFDPFRDVAQVSLKAVTHSMLSYLSGVQKSRII